jgi:hypothetical protein
VIVRYLNLQLPMEPVPITTNIVSSNAARGDVHSIQHYVRKANYVLFRCQTVPSV